MRRAGTILCTLLAVALCGALLWIDHCPEPRPLLGDEGIYWDLAARMRAGEEVSVPLLWPPLYPRFLAAVLSATGGSRLGFQLVQLALLAGVALVVRDLGRRLVPGTAVGDTAAWMLLLYPPLVATALAPRPEVLHLALFAGALWILAARRERLPWVALFGALLGLSLLAKSLLLPFLPVLFLPLAREGAPRARALRVATAAAALLVCVAPTLAANHRRTGSLALEGSAWFNLWVGLEDTSRRNLRQPFVARAYRLFEASGDTHAERNAAVRRAIGERVGERGLPRVAWDQLSRQYFRLFDKDSYLTDQLPGGIVAARGGGYRGPPAVLAAGLRLGSFAFYAAVLVLASLGAALTHPRRQGWAALALAFLAYNLALFFFVHVKTRFRVPLLPFLFFFAAYAVAWWRARGRGAAEPPARGALPAAALAAALLLFLAFGGAYLD